MNKQFTLYAVLFLFGVLWGLMEHSLRRADGFEVYALDVGQGDAILLRSPSQESILIDGGQGDQVLSELGEVLPYWNRDIDLLVLTHPHLDHMEGLISVLEDYRVHEALLSLPEYDTKAYARFLEVLENSGTPFHLAEVGQVYEFGPLSLEVLFPFEAISGEELSNINNASVILRADCGESSALFSGDAEDDIEALLVENFGDAVGGKLDVDLYKAGHHGSSTSSSSFFLDAITPENILVSVGEGNRFGHPHAEFLERSAPYPVRRTDLEGRLKEVMPCEI